MARKPSGLVVASAPQPSAPAVKRMPRAGSREGKVPVTIWISLEASSALKHLAVDRRTNLQDLGLRAFDMLMRDEGLPEIFKERREVAA